MSKILIVDDEATIRTSLKSALEHRGHQVVTAATIAEGRTFVSGGFDLVLLDVKLPDGNGVAFLEELSQQTGDLTVVMISGHADISDAVRAIQLGAYDFIEKPLSLDRLMLTIDNATRTRRLRDETKRLSHRLYGELIGESPVIRSLREDIVRAARRTDKFLIVGENGTGKELVAHLVHSHGRNAAGPFVAVNCAALPSELVESELFGHTAGAYTGARKARRGRFQEADGGTIFLDEISEMPPDAQAKILRVIESRQLTPVGSDKEVSIDCVIIAASNRNLDDEVTRGRLRQDLFYRLNIVTFHLPPLRERIEDIPLLASHFLQRLSHESGCELMTLTTEAVRELQQLPFPGNVRELRNLMERLSIYGDTPQISAHDIRALSPQRVDHTTHASLKEAVEQFEREYIQAALKASSGQVTAAARQLGLERSHLYKKMKKLGLP